MLHVKLSNVSLRNHPQLNERWLQEIIESDPSIIGLGDLTVRDRERRQSGGGRLDLLLQDPESFSRYEVEIQLGPTDESHIIRTIEYWDVERRKYPQYEHTAVIIAEDITSRFFNVISLFNGFIPLVAIQVNAIQTPEGIGLHFTKILDTLQLGFLDEDEGTTQQADRNYWETKRGTPQTVKIADKVLEIVREFCPAAELSYNRPYIGIRIEGKACNFAICFAQKSALRLNIKLPQSEELDTQLEATGVDVLDYEKKSGFYRLKLRLPDIDTHREFLKQLLESALKLRQ